MNNNFDAGSWFIDEEKKTNDVSIPVVRTTEEKKPGEKTNIALVIVTSFVLVISAICNIVALFGMINYYYIPDYVMRGMAAFIQLVFAVLIPIFRKKSVVYFGLIISALFFLAESIIIMVYAFG